MSWSLRSSWLEGSTTALLSTNSRPRLVGLPRSNSALPRRAWGQTGAKVSGGGKWNLVAPRFTLKTLSPAEIAGNNPSCTSTPVTTGSHSPQSPFFANHSSPVSRSAAAPITSPSRTPMEASQGTPQLAASTPVMDSSTDASPARENSLRTQPTRGQWPTWEKSTSKKTFPRSTRAQGNPTTHGAVVRKNPSGARPPRFRELHCMIALNSFQDTSRSSPGATTSARIFRRCSKLLWGRQRWRDAMVIDPAGWASDSDTASAASGLSIAWDKLSTASRDASIRKADRTLAQLLTSSSLSVALMKSVYVSRGPSPPSSPVLVIVQECCWSSEGVWVRSALRMACHSSGEASGEQVMPHVSKALANSSRSTSPEQSASAATNHVLKSPMSASPALWAITWCASLRRFGACRKASSRCAITLAVPWRSGPRVARTPLSFMAWA
mmetsp:Transcript_51362/g.135430  ORF Transcript_51362/g.135430 Transcript_51362/m.135430 type:complete len:439 (+) Transcript_51362:356-1672(+)